MGCCDKKIIVAEKAPKPVGPYSVGVQACHFLFTAGQIGLNPQSGNIVSGGVEKETRQVLNNLKAVLEAAGSSLDKVVKTTMFLKDINDFGTVNSIYSEYFIDNPPARSAIQVAALPKGALVEIEAIALVPKQECECESKS